MYIYKLTQLNLLYPLDLTPTQHELILVPFRGGGRPVYIFIKLTYPESSILDYPDLTCMCVSRERNVSAVVKVTDKIRSK